LSLYNFDGDTQDFTCDLAGAPIEAGDGSLSDGIVGDGGRDFIPLAGTVTLAGTTTMSLECNGFQLGVTGYLEALAIQ
jgi:hypothetical protein